MTIDAHQHFWRYESARHDWIAEDMRILRRDHLPAELEDIYRQHGIDGCVSVQVEQSAAETDFLLQLAEAHDFIRGVVGWVDLRVEQLTERLDRYAGLDKLVGFRHIAQSEPSPNFLLRPDFRRGISRLASYGFTYDILIYPHQMGAALELVRQFPRQRFVIDHLAKPYIREGYYDGWALLMRALARYDNVWCKVSGLVTEADWANWKYEDFIPYLDLVFEVFGPYRLMYGSDWPVSRLGGEYGRVKGILERYTATLSRAEQQAFWGGTATDFYGLKP